MVATAAENRLIIKRNLYTSFDGLGFGGCDRKSPGVQPI
jgi:hypothetical protein